MGAQAQRSRQAERSVQREILFPQRVRKSLVTILIGLGVPNIAHEAQPGAAAFDQPPGDLPDAGAALNQHQIAVKRGRMHSGHRIQKNFGQRKLVKHMQQPCVINIQYDQPIHVLHRRGQGVAL